MSVVEIAGRDEQAASDAPPGPRGSGAAPRRRASHAVTASSLNAHVRSEVRDGWTHMLIDRRAVTAFDAAGVAALLEARRVLEAQPRGTLVLRANAVVCRALKDTGTITAFALWTGRGM
jgi:hypothetical protein